METKDLNLNEILTQEELDALKGGQAIVYDSLNVESSSGDGAKYVCCTRVEEL